MRLFLYLAILAASVGGMGKVLAMEPLPKPKPVDRPTPFPPVTCSNLVEQLAKLKAAASEQNQSVAAFMDDVVVKMDGWHRELVNLEGKSVSIAPGQFLPIRNGVQEISDVQAMVWDILGRVDSRFDEILQVLPSCLK